MPTFTAMLLGSSQALLRLFSFHESYIFIYLFIYVTEIGAGLDGVERTPVQVFFAVAICYTGFKLLL